MLVTKTYSGLNFLLKYHYITGNTYFGQVCGQNKSKLSKYVLVACGICC